VLALVLDLPLAWAQYPTSMPEGLFRVSLLISFAVSVVLLVALMVLALGVLVVCFPRAAAVADPAARRPVAASAVWVALAVLGAWTTVTAVVALVRGAAPHLFPAVPVTVPGEVATAVPALAGLGGAATLALFLLALAALTAHLWRDAQRPLLRMLLAIGVTVALIPSGADATWPELVTGLVGAALFVAVAVLLVRKLPCAALAWWRRRRPGTGLQGAVAPSGGSYYDLKGGVAGRSWPAAGGCSGVNARPGRPRLSRRATSPRPRARARHQQVVHAATRRQHLAHQRELAAGLAARANTSRGVPDHSTARTPRRRTRRPSAASRQCSSAEHLPRPSTASRPP
jgi:hypothetical protein